MSKYSESGVDVEAGYRSVKLIKSHVDSTSRDECIGSLGGFGGLFSIEKLSHNLKSPILVSGADGVGTKLKLAFLLDRHDTIGIDCVAMCVNDVICCGAEPLFFLDYIACGKNYPEKIEKIVCGIANGCKMSNCALIGGETAEMPGFYKTDDYDLAGFCVGIVDKDKMITSKKQQCGDVLVGLESSGVHSNGFSLIRKIFNIDENPNVLAKKYNDLNATLGEALLEPTKIYVKAILDIVQKIELKGIVHITGGGFFENIPRGLKDCIGVDINKKLLFKNPIFDIIQREGAISDSDMFNTFNMGVGMCCIVSENDADALIEICKQNDIAANVIGQLNQNGEVRIL